MISDKCELATRAGLQLRPSLKGRMHTGCPGWVMTLKGEPVQCSCACHGEDRGDVAPENTLLPLGRPDAREKAEKTEKRPHVAAKGPGRCIHCGEPTRGGRFAPGHDAKLKRILVDSAVNGSHHAWCELELRDWVKLVKVRPAGTVGAGRRMAHELRRDGVWRDWLEKRDRRRMGLDDEAAV